MKRTRAIPGAAGANSFKAVSTFALVLMGWGVGIPSAFPAEGPSGAPVIAQNFEGTALSKEWKAPKKRWGIKDGVLAGTGSGHLEYTPALPQNFVLTFDARTGEKANIEVKLHDARTDKLLYTFAYLGKYHSVLKGVKSCILKEGGFVNVNPRMWIFPGRTFKFEIRCIKNQFQMFLDGELGPVFVDEAPAAETDVILRIEFSPEGKKDIWQIDNIRIKRLQ